MTQQQNKQETVKQPNLMFWASPMEETIFTLNKENKTKEEGREFHYLSHIKKPQTSFYVTNSGWREFDVLLHTIFFFLSHFMHAVFTYPFYSYLSIAQM